MYKKLIKILVILLILGGAIVSAKYLLTDYYSGGFVVPSDEVIKEDTNEDLNGDKNPERIIITRYSHQEFVYLSKLYLVHDGTVQTTNLKGVYTDKMITDLNSDGGKELVVYLTSGQLITLQIFDYSGKEILLKDGGKDIKPWSSERPAVLDLDNDGKAEIVVTHRLPGERATETIIKKEFYRWDGDGYLKYKEEKTIEGEGFSG